MACTPNARIPYICTCAYICKKLIKTLNLHPKGERYGNPYIQDDAHLNGQHKKYSKNVMVIAQSIYINKWWCMPPHRPKIWEGLFHQP